MIIVIVSIVLIVSLKEDVRVITLRNFNGTIRERVLDGSHAFEALMEGLELRL